MAGGVLVNALQLTSQTNETHTHTQQYPPVGSICRFPRCDGSHHERFQAPSVTSLSAEVGRDAHRLTCRASL